MSPDLLSRIDIEQEIIHSQFHAIDRQFTSIFVNNKIDHQLCAIDRQFSSIFVNYEIDRQFSSISVNLFH